MTGAFPTKALLDIAPIFSIVREQEGSYLIVTSHVCFLLAITR